MKETPTRKIRFRTDRKGRVILQIQREYLLTTSIGGTIDTEWHKDWRDAKLEDIPINWKQLEKGAK